MAYLEGRKKYFTTGIKVKKDQWNGSQVVNHQDARIFNYDLQDKISKLRKFESDNRDNFVFENLNVFDRGFESQTFLDWLQDKIDKNNIGSETKRHHNSLKNMLESFGGIKYFSDFNYDNLVKFDHWLRTNKTDKNTYRTKTTVNGYHRRLKPYAKEALKLRLIKENPYLYLDIDPGKYADRKFLTKSDLALIENTEVDKSLQLTKDLFLFQCYTGIPYEAIYKITIENISQDESNNLWLKYNRSKTEENAVVMLLDKAISILAKYSGQEKCFPVYVNQTYNKYLKVLAAACSIKKNLTTHVARHTFSTTIALDNGLSLETLQKILGHAKISTTQIYGKITENRIKDEMTELAKKLT